MNPASAGRGARPVARTRARAAARLAVVLVIVAVGVVAACGSSASPAASGPGSSGAATPSAHASPVQPTPSIAHETGTNDLVLQAASGGGLIPREMRLTELPDVSIYGDGRVIRPGEASGDAAAPLVPSLVEARLTPDGMARVLSAAAEAGLLGPDRHYGLEGVYDLWTTTFTLTANGATHRISAYALGFEDEARLAPPSEIGDRERLGTLYERLLDLRGWLGESGIGTSATRQPERMRVFLSEVTSPSDDGTTWGPATAAPGQEVRAWPLDADPSLFGEPVGDGTWRCAVADAGAASLLGIDTATRDTRWEAVGHLYRIVVRPLLPHEAGCTATPA